MIREISVFHSRRETPESLSSSECLQWPTTRERAIAKSKTLLTTVLKRDEPRVSRKLDRVEISIPLRTMLKILQGSSKHDFTVRSFMKGFCSLLC